MLLLLITVIALLLLGIAMFAVSYSKASSKVDSLSQQLHQQDAQLNQHAATIKELTQRTQILEAIVTDAGFDLKQEINNL